MKKKMNEIKGTLLSNKQMKEFTGGWALCPCGDRCLAGSRCRMASGLDRCACDGAGQWPPRTL
jgi:hypothetical protein